MKLKVIKAIKGLVPGDILEYNEKDDSYEIWKVEEDISEGKQTKKTLKVVISSYLVNDYKEYLEFIDNEGNSIQVEEFEYKDCITAQVNREADKKMADLEKENESLKKQLDSWVISLRSNAIELEDGIINVDITSDAGKKILSLVKENVKLEEDKQSWQSECIRLTNQVKRLEQQLETLEDLRQSSKYMFHSTPFRTIFTW